MTHVEIRTQTEPNARLSVLVIADGRPCENVFIGLRYEVLPYRAKMIDRYSDGRADTVEANAVPFPRQ